jgi:excisionase family DNA binding protein
MLSLHRESRPRALLTVREVASMLGCGRTLVYDLIGARELPVVKVGRLTRVPIEAVDHFIRGHVRDTGPPVMSTRPCPPNVRHPRTRAETAADSAQPQLFDDIP